jgi:ATP-dependent Lon protease
MNSLQKSGFPMDQSFDRQSPSDADAVTPVAASQPSANDAGGAVELPDDILPILPLRNAVLFPGAVMPLSIRQETALAAAQFGAMHQRPIGILLQRDPEASEPAAGDLHEVGTVASIVRYLTTPDGRHHLVCRGEQRFRIVEFVEGHPFLAARIERIDEPELAGLEIDGRMMQLKRQAAEALKLFPGAPEELAAGIQAIAAPSMLADTVAGLLDVKPAEKQTVLETIPLVARFDRVLGLLAYSIEVLRLSNDIGERTQKTIAGRQREHFLREQMQTIQKELGDDESGASENADLKKALLEAKMPADVEKHALKELGRLAKMPDSSGESGMVRSYLELLAELPWTIPEQEPIDIGLARKVLGEDHHGLEKVKKRILEYLAVRKLNPDGKAPILCFVGPPGVGKTSLGQSIARALGRKFERVSLGGVHDEAEIRGHRRTYIGALPGNIIQAIRKAGARDGVIMLDEIDKLGRGVHGDPYAALLEVLDPAQNGTFRDNYLAVPFDLSKIVFIATANMLDSISGPLLDRLEVIRLSGYTESEKLQIAERYLVPRQRETNGLKEGQAEITDDALKSLIHDYTREAGVRNLEREVGSVFRNAAVRIAEESATQVTISAGDLLPILGPKRFEPDIAEGSSEPGVVTGLAWTPVGGDILFIEATRIKGSGKFTLTGQLGDVMKESVQAALTLVKARALPLGIDPKLFEECDVHVHVPAGAIPKDGPSAGVAMFMALASLFTGRAVKPDFAMTGEISLRGRVLPVGGIKEKVLAAAAAGIRTVMLPARNRKDFDEIPEETRNALSFVWLEKVEDALAPALAPLLEAGNPEPPLY